MAKKLLVVFTLLSMCLVSGCWDLREINASVIATGVGIDLAKNDQIIFSTQLVQSTVSSESGSKTNEPVTVSAVDSSVTMGARRVMLSLSLIPEWAHVKTVLFGETILRKDLYLCVDFMTRSRNIRPDSDMLVCVGSTPEEVLSSQLPQGSNLGAGLMDMLGQNERVLGIYVPTTLEEFTYRLSTPGIEPVVPQITLAEASNSGQSSGTTGMMKKDSKGRSKKPVLIGMAVFKRTKMVGSLNEYESRGYRWLNSSSQQGGYFTIKSPLKPNEIVGLEIISFRSKVKPQIDGDNIKMNIEVKANLGFYEQTGTGELLTDQMIKRLEQAANLEIKRQITSCIDQSQTLESDILGWGKTISINQPEEWKRLHPDWSTIYPSVDSNVQVQSQISGSYLSAKSFQFQ